MRLAVGKVSSPPAMELCSSLQIEDGVAHYAWRESEIESSTRRSPRGVGANDRKQRVEEPRPAGRMRNRPRMPRPTVAVIEGSCARQYEHGAVLSIQAPVQRVAHLVAAILSHVLKSRHMTYDLSHFNLGDMLKSSLRLREAATGAPTLEAAAQRVCRFLYDELSGPDSERACALVRCYKTHPYGSLEPELQRFAKKQLKGEAEPRSTMKCLTLLATVGAKTPPGTHAFFRWAIARFHFPVPR